MDRHVLVPVDGSPLSVQALEVAVTELPEATIIALHVVDPTEPGYSYYPYDGVMDLDAEPVHGTEEWYARADELAAELFEDARAVADEHGVELETELVVGDPGRAIVEYARDHDVDHVVLGSHGRSEDARLLLGSVTETVAFRAPCRVTLVR